MNTMTFRALFEHSSIGIIISNVRGEILRSNPFAEKMFGYGPGELIDRSIEDLVPASLRKKHVAYREQYNRDPINRAMGGMLTVEGLKKNGESLPVEISLTYFDDEDGMRIVSFISDITERKNAERNLENLANELESKVEERTKELSDALVELNLSHKIIEQEVERRKTMEADIRESLEKEKELSQLKSRFVSMASHEFRTPLGGILSSASLLGRYNQPEHEEKREKHINTIKKSVTHLTAILNEFLSLDKLDQGIIESTPSAFSLAELVDDVAEGVQEIADKNQKVLVKHMDGDVKLFQDPEILRNALINLMSNASKYSPEESEIIVESELLGNKESRREVALRIKDRGIGIPEQDQKHLFERFFRAQNAGTIQGTGLGLNIVKSYLDLLKGRIEFISKEGIGTTFTIILPIDQNINATGAQK